MPPTHSNSILMDVPPAALTVSTKQLMEMLNCGRPTAVRIGIEAGAKIAVGERKILWNLALIQRYLDAISQ